MIQFSRFLFVFQFQNVYILRKSKTYLYTKSFSSLTHEVTEYDTFGEWIYNSNKCLPKKSDFSQKELHKLLLIIIQTCT